MEYEEYARRKLYEVHIKVMIYSEAARLCGTKGFNPRNKRLKNMPNKTPPAIEKKIMQIRRETGYRAIKISRIMKERDLCRGISNED